ncbi:MAG: REP-associated tyrosine transposase [Gaiellaceae bacterium]
MPRSPRSLEPNALSHVTSRGNRGEPIFTDSADFARFLAILEQATVRFRWRCLAYCLMTNHYHLIVQTPEPNISQAMHRLNGGYARWFNRRHGYRGHLFQRRFHAAAIESDWHMLEACRYVVLNPVRAGLARRPAEWEWSSYRATVGTAPKTCTLALDELLGFFGARRAREAFRAFVDDAVVVPRRNVPSEQGQVPGTRAWPD